MLILAGEEGRVRATIAQGHAKTLRRTHRDIGAHRARFFQHGQRQQVGRHHRNRLGTMQRLDPRCQVAHMAPGAGILEDRGKHGFRLQLGRVTHHHLDPQRQGAGLDHGNGLRMAAFIDKERLGLRLRHPLGHGHGFRRRRGLVQQAGIGDRQAGQIGHHGLKVQ